MSLELMSFASNPQPRVTRNTPYRVCVYRTRTGEVVKWLPLAATPRWESGINMPGSWQVMVSLDQRYLTKSELSGLTEAWYWSWAIVQGSSIYQAGPVISESFGDGGDTHTTVSGIGLWGLYKEKRVLINAARANAGAVTPTDADFAFGTGTVSEKGAPIPLERRNLNLATVAKRILENEQAKAGGAVPLVIPLVDGAGSTVRDWLASDLAMTGNRLFDLTQVQGGPEIELRAEFADTERSHVQHVALIGNPRIGRLDYPHAWSYGKALTNLGIERDGSRMITHRWDRGAGFDRNVRTGFAANTDGVTTGSFQQRPLLESVGQLHSDNADQASLDGYAAAEVSTGQSAMLNLTVEVSIEGDDGTGGDPPSPTMDSLRNGDTGIFNVRNHPRLSDGTYYIRVLKMGSGSSAKRGRLTVDLLKVVTA